ncbi:transcription termination factor 3, mitochondrial-like [Penaeus japonicus]|uniref:transcription termination factor 3, mitochondrial-like n=1 Tax=Penaeus japonicus TaxID=27405 RepID=UPI001C70D28F|nr:transcription termination factor 3, mitochondrial-like [Penaeus japonicus]
MMWMQCRRTATIFPAMFLQYRLLVPCLRRRVFTCSFVPKKNHGNILLSALNRSDSSTYKFFYKSTSYAKDSSYELEEKENCEIVNNEVRSVSVVDETLPSNFGTSNWENEMKLSDLKTRDVLVSLKDPSEIDLLSPELRPTFNLASYLNISTTLQEMVKLGVDISRWEKRKGISSYILKLEFQRDMKQHIMFLHHQGVKPEDLGRWLTLNPLIFREKIEDLQSRINYLEAVKFNKDEIARLVSRNPHWLLFSTVRIDNRLGFFQRMCDLSRDEVRAVAVKEPRLITHNLHHVKRTSFAVSEEMGFSKDEMKCLILSSPKLWIMHGPSLLRRFNYTHNEMGLSHSLLVKFPKILQSREIRLKQRHIFLKNLGRAQYDPRKPNYVSPASLIEGNDLDFCNNVAKSTIHDFNIFLKTL